MTTPAAFLDSRLEKGVLVLTVTLREITDEVAGPLRDELLDAVVKYRAYRVVLDLSHVEHFSSAAFMPLLALQRYLQAVGGKLIIASPGAIAETLLTVSGLQPLFETAADADAARAAFRDRALGELLEMPLDLEPLGLPGPGPPDRLDARRYSDVSFPPRVPVGKPTNLRVRIATSRHHGHDAELALELPVGVATLAVTVCVAAENLTIESDPQATLLVPPDGDSPAVQFRLVGEQVGPGRVMIDFDQDGRPVGSVDLAVEVGGQTDEAAPAPAVEVLLSGGQLPAPDVTLTVHEYRHWPGRLHFTLFSRHPRLKDLPWVNHGDLGTVELRQDTIRLGRAPARPDRQLGRGGPGAPPGRPG
jgi:anti-anti-sigma factor